MLSGRFSNRRVAGNLRSLVPKQQESEVEMDEDVRAEMDKVANGGANGDVIKVGVMIDSLSK